MESPTSLNALVAAALRAEMANQRKTVSGLARALGRERSAAQRVHDGHAHLTLDDLDAAAAWLGIDRRDLLTRYRTGGPQQ